MGGREEEGGGVSRVIAPAPVGQGANTGVNELRISSNRHLLILIGTLAGNATRYVFMLTVSRALRIQYLALVM